MIKIIYFASLREQIGRSEEQLDLPANVTTLAALIAHLGELHGDQWRDQINGSKVLTAVNQEMCELDQQIRDGDEIALFPPVTGG